MAAPERKNKQSHCTYPQHAPVELCELYEAEDTRIADPADPYVALLGAILGQDSADPYQYDAMNRVWRVLSRKGMTGPLAISWFSDVVYLSSNATHDQIYKMYRSVANKRVAEQQHVQKVVALRQMLAKERKERPGFFQLLEEHEELRHLAHLDELQERPTTWGEMNQGQKQKRINDIADAASSLHDLLVHTPFDRSVFRYMGNDAGDILQLLRPEFLSDANRGSMSEDQFLERSLLRPKVTSFLFNLRLLALGNATQIHETPHGKQKYRYKIPSIDLLEDDPDDDRKNGNLYKYFILQIDGYFQNKFNEHLYGTIATLTNVVFKLHGTDDELSKATVLGAIRNASP